MPTSSTPQSSQDVIAGYPGEMGAAKTKADSLVLSKTRTGLMVAGAMLFISEMFAMSRLKVFSPVIFVIGIAAALVLIGLSFWSKKRPYTALTLGLTLFIIIVAVNAGLMSQFYSSNVMIKALGMGAIFKVLGLFGLIRPLKDAKEIQERTS